MPQPRFDSRPVAPQLRYPGPLFVRYPDLAVKLNFLSAFRRMVEKRGAVLYFPTQNFGSTGAFSGGVVPNDGLMILEREITNCRKCPRLVEYREEIARTKRRAYRGWTYWGRPVPAFGDPEARLVIIGLAPAAHGANRTGRMFTGDRSGDFLYEQLFRAGFANQPQSKRADDGLILKGALISAAIRCAPPANKPLPEEIRNCLPYLERELVLVRPRAILALGGIALNTYLDLLKRQGLIASRAAYPFAHGASFALPGDFPRLFAAYHPSQQNTQTGRLTPAMFARVLRKIRRFLDSLA